MSYHFFISLEDAAQNEPCQGDPMEQGSSSAREARLTDFLAGSAFFAVCFGRAMMHK